MIVSFVYAASQGEDFQWLSTSVQGLRIGAPGNEGELPTADSLEFTESGAAVRFLADGAMGATGGSLISAVGDLSGGEGEGEVFVPQSMLLLSQEAEGENAGDAGLIALNGNAGFLSGQWDGGDILPASSVHCTPTGDVIVQLGNAALGGEGEGEGGAEGEGEGEGEGGQRLLAGGGGEGEQRSALESGAIRELAVYPTGYRLRMPTIRWP